MASKEANVFVFFVVNCSAFIKEHRKIFISYVDVFIFNSIHECAVNLYSKQTRSSDLEHNIFMLTEDLPRIRSSTSGDRGDLRCQRAETLGNSSKQSEEEDCNHRSCLETLKVVLDLRVNS